MKTAIASTSLLFRTAYSESFKGSSVRCGEPSLAQQSFKDEVDINVLMERFKVTGQMPSGLRVPQFGDFSGVTDFRSAAAAVLAAQEAFMALPAKVRNRFGNDPQAYAEFCLNPANRDELISLGIIEAAPAAASPDVPPAGTPAGGPAS